MWLLFLEISMSLLSNNSSGSENISSVINPFSFNKEKRYWDISKEVYLKHGFRRKPLIKRKNFPKKRDFKLKKEHQYELNIEL